MNPGVYQRLRPWLFRLPPELAHRLTLLVLKTGLIKCEPFEDPVLETSLWGMDFSNPVGLAAGFDKDAEVIAATAALGFGFTEAGTVTPRPQRGNARPRIFRDEASRSVINSMGFPGQGAVEVRCRLARGDWPEGFRVGINIGKNKDTLEAATDYVRGVEDFAPLADFLVINISSPNTAGLRDLQKRENLLPLLKAVMEARQKSGCNTPLLAKLAPDLDEAARADIAAAVLEAGIDGLVISNTTLARPPGLPSDYAANKGGLSGAPLTELACALTADMYRRTGGRLPIIGVGGISTAEQAYARIRAGASLLEVYTGLIYEGPGLARALCEGLAGLLKKDGFSSLAQAVGVDVKL